MTTFANVFALLKRWRAISAILIGYAHTLVRLEKTNGPGAWEMATQLDISARAALALCLQEIQAYTASDPPETEDSHNALVHLHSIACAMLSLSYFARRIQRNLAGRRSAGFHMFGASAAFTPREIRRAYPAPAREIPILDPG